MRPALPLHIDGKLLPLSQLEHDLTLATQKESEETSDGQREELEQRSHDERDAARVRREEEA